MSAQKQTIVIVGGGVAATAAATALEASLKSKPGYEIVLVTGKEYFYHLIAGLRANVASADVAEKIAVPYDRLFKDKDIARIITKKASEIRSDRVVLEDGTEIPFAYCFVATGQEWTKPIDVPQARSEAISRMKAYRERVANAKNILIVGGGAVGLEIAGEIAEAYPPSAGKKVTLIHNKPMVLNDAYTEKLRRPLQKQAEEMGVQFILDDSLEGSYDFMESPQTITTKKGKTLNDVDLVIQSTGGKVNAYVLEKLVPNLISRNGVKVEPTLQVPGYKNIFVIGDLADLPEQKQAMKAPNHAAIAAKNVLASIDGKPLSSYKGGPEMIVVVLGSTKGMGQLTFPIVGTVYPGAWFARMVKGKELFVAKTRAQLGY